VEEVRTDKATSGTVIEVAAMTLALAEATASMTGLDLKRIAGSPTVARVKVEALKMILGSAKVSRKTHALKMTVGSLRATGVALNLIVSNSRMLDRRPGAILAAHRQTSSVETQIEVSMLARNKMFWRMPGSLVVTCAVAVATLVNSRVTPGTSTTHGSHVTSMANHVAILAGGATMGLALAVAMTIVHRRDFVPTTGLLQKEVAKEVLLLMGLVQESAGILMPVEPNKIAAM